MLHDLPTSVAGSNEAPTVTRLEFTDSGITVEGRFRLNEFATLAPEPLEFLRLYIKVRGNLKEVERVLGVSYPTVRARFDAMLRALGYEPGPADDNREDVLAALERGEIDASEAVERLRRP